MFIFSVFQQTTCFLNLKKVFSTNFWSISCSGNNYGGQLGTGNTDWLGDNSGEMGDDLITIQLGDGFITNKVVAGHYFNCVLGNGNAIKCFGKSRSIFSVL